MTADTEHKRAASLSPLTAELALQVTRLGIDTSQHPVAFLPANSPLCRSEGFNSLSRVELLRGDQHLLVTLNIVDPQWVAAGSIGEC